MCQFKKGNVPAAAATRYFAYFETKSVPTTLIFTNFAGCVSNVTIAIVFYSSTDSN